MQVEMIERGGADPFVLINSGAGTYDHTTGVPTGRQLVAGDMLWMDCGCSVRLLARRDRRHAVAAAARHARPHR